jgi:hypothetical protein
MTSRLANWGINDSLGSFGLWIERVGLPLTSRPPLAVQAQEEESWEGYKTLRHFLPSTRVEESQVVRIFSCHLVQLVLLAEGGSRSWDWLAD